MDHGEVSCDVMKLVELAQDRVHSDFPVPKNAGKILTS
jgi:hypothetical protein